MRNRYRERTYRSRIRHGRLVSFDVKVKETDLLIHGNACRDWLAREAVLKHRGHIESFVARHPEFLSSLTPWRVDGPAPSVVRNMAAASQKAGVGPMAAVAGAIAEAVGSDLLAHTEGLQEVIVENGGDLFIQTTTDMLVGIYAGKSPLSFRIGLKVDSEKCPIAVCTSSGTVGHSISFGKADAVCVVSRSCSLADAAATAIGNRVTSAKKGIRAGIDIGKKIDGVEGIVVVVEGEIGIWGDLDLLPLNEKNLEF